MPKDPMLVGWDDGKIYFYLKGEEHCVSGEQELFDQIILLCRQYYEQKASQRAETRGRKKSS